MEEESKNNQNTLTEIKQKWSKVSIAALVLSIFALLFTVRENMFSKNDVMRTLNGTISNVIVPEIKRAKHTTTVQTVYELKHVIITLERLIETTENEEIKMQVQQIIQQIKDLSVKAFILE